MAKFVKGQSGNPGGRPKEVVEVRELARQYTAEAIGTLARHMRGRNQRASIAACMALLDRGWGRPAQFVGETTPAAPVDDRTLAMILAEASRAENAALERIAPAASRTPGSAGNGSENGSGMPTSGTLP